MKFSGVCAPLSCTKRKAHLFSDALCSIVNKVKLSMSKKDTIFESLQAKHSFTRSKSHENDH